jgi:hypothetical protein
MMRAETALQEKIGSKNPAVISKWIEMSGGGKSGEISAAELTRILRPLATGIVDV